MGYVARLWRRRGRRKRERSGGEERVRNTQKGQRLSKLLQGISTTNTGVYIGNKKWRLEQWLRG